MAKISSFNAVSHYTLMLVASVLLPLIVGATPYTSLVQQRRFFQPQTSAPNQISKRSDDAIFASRQDLFRSLKKPTAEQLNMRIPFLHGENLYPRTLLDTVAALDAALLKATELNLFPKINPPNGVKAAAHINTLQYPYLVLSFPLPIEPYDASNKGYLLMPVYPKNPRTLILKDLLSFNLVAYYPRPTGTYEVGQPVFQNIAEAITLEQYARGINDESGLLPVCLVKSLSDFEKAAEATIRSQNLVYSNNNKLSVIDWWGEMHRNIEKYWITLP